MAKHKTMLHSAATNDQSPLRKIVPPSDTFETSSGTVIDPSVAYELAAVRAIVIGPGLARRIWTNCFVEADRRRLGSDLAQARQEHQGNVGMYMVARHVSYEVALLEIAVALEIITERKFRRLMQAIGGVDRNRPTPVWDGERLQLTLESIVIRRVRSRAISTNICRLLDAFEESGWAGRIDDPLPDGADHQRLREAVRTLNRDLTRVRFRTDGTGEGVSWDFI